MFQFLLTPFLGLSLLWSQPTGPIVMAKVSVHQRMVEIVAPFDDTDPQVVRAKMAGAKVNLVFSKTSWEVSLPLDDGATMIETRPFWKIKSGRLIEKKENSSIVPNAEIVDHAVIKIPAKTITDFISNTISPAVNAVPTDLKIIRDGDRAHFEDAMIDGRRVNQEATLQTVLDAFEQGKDNAKVVVETILASEAQFGRKVQLVGFDDPQNPQGTNLRVESLIGVGVSDFSRSPANRRNNIRVGLEKMNGVIIRQGETFSFNENLGPVNATNGYLRELVIQGGDVTPEYGGGLCQVSTTIFRAALKSGLPIVQRKNHSLAVKYYNGPDEWDWWGSDATTYAPSLDLKFTNDTPGDIVLRTSLDDDSHAYVYMYGMPDGRSVEITNQQTYGGKAGANRSFTASFDYNVSMPDRTFREQTFTSRYSAPKHPH